MKLIINALGERFTILSLRKAFEEPTDFQQVPFFTQKLLPLIAPPVFFKFI